MGELKPNFRGALFGTITATADKLRWTGNEIAGPSATRIAVLGGSTTFGSGVSDAETWRAQLQELLGSDYKVFNFGMPGYSTAENIIQMSLLVPEIAPDVVVYNLGWNDIRQYFNPGDEPDYYSHGRQQFLALDLPGPAHNATWSHLARKSALARLVQIFVEKLTPTTAASGKLHQEPDPRVDRFYARNLETLNVLAERFGARPVFVPQLINYARFQATDEAHTWTPTIPQSEMRRLMAHFNGVMRDACERAGCEVATEVLQRDWAEDDFVDSGHFSGPGGREFAKLIARRIRSAAPR